MVCSEGLGRGSFYSVIVRAGPVMVDGGVVATGFSGSGGSGGAVHCVQAVLPGVMA